MMGTGKEGALLPAFDLKLRECDGEFLTSFGLKSNVLRSKEVNMHSVKMLKSNTQCTTPIV